MEELHFDDAYVIIIFSNVLTLYNETKTTFKKTGKVDSGGAKTLYLINGRP